MDNIHDWKIKSLAKGVDPNLAVSELNRIHEKYGSLNPEQVVDESQDKEAILHNLFEWDNTKAAQHYRLQQARTIINNIEVTVVSNGEPKTIGAFEIVTVKDEKTYKQVTALTINELDEVRKETINQLSLLRKKLTFFEQFSSVSKTLGEALNQLERVS